MDKREKILEAALKLFTEFGFHGTPTSKIAKEAGVANGTLFHYFKSKEELVVELYKSVKGKSSAYLLEDYEEDAEAKERLRHLYLNFLYWALENPLEMRFMEQFRSSPYVQNLSKKELEADRTFHIEAIKQGIEEGVIKLKDVDYIIMLLASQAFGLYSYLQQKKISKSKQHQTISETFELVWRMLT